MEAIQHCNIVTCLASYVSLLLPPLLSTQSGGGSPVHIAARCGIIPALELIWEWCDVFGTEGENGGKFELFKEPDEVSFMKNALWKKKHPLLNTASCYFYLQKGWTPLHHAVATNQSIVVEWLLEKRDLTRLSVDAPSEVCVHKWQCA